MISDSCKVALKEWAQDAVWHSRRDADITRFNRAIAEGIVDHATIQQFQVAIREVVKPSGADLRADDLEKVLGEYVQRADAVFNFHRSYSGV